MSADTTVQAEFVDVPIPLTGIADERTSTSETLRGSVDPNSTTISDCHFDYVSAADYNPAAPDPYGAGPSAGTVPCATVPTEPAPVAAVASNLSPKTTYHFRLQASSDGVTGYGADHTFTSLPIPPTVATAEANPVDRVTATLRGTFNPEGSEASFHFAYVSDASYEPAAEDPYAAGATTPVIYGGSGGEDVAAAEPIHGLSPETTYHFALVAVGPGGAVRSEPDRTFTTDQARPPSAATGPATAIGATTVTLNGTLDADGLPTTYRFELGPTTAYDTTVSGSAGEAKGAFEVALPLSGLASATTYHFRLIAHNADGTSIGADATFTTTAFPLGVLPLLPDLKPTPVVPPPTPCRHGFFKRHGRCLKKPHHRRSHKRAEARHAKSNRSARR
jgi:hypothetical protein